MAHKTLQEIFAHNERWRQERLAEDPAFFARLSQAQTPKYLFIGCSDSRISTEALMCAEPGDVFVHRNVANVVVPTDLNCLSTIQYAVDQLKVKHLMVVGHYGCGGVKAALLDLRVGLADNWLRHVRDVADRHYKRMQRVPEARKLDALCELNAIEQVVNVAQSTVMQDAWSRGQDVTLHGWVYGISDGLVNDMRMTCGSNAELLPVYKQALENWDSRYCA